MHLQYKFPRLLSGARWCGNGETEVCKVLFPALKAAGVEQIAGLKWNGIAYGSFLSAVINFLVIGTVLFFIVKSVEKAQSLTKKEEDTAEEAAGPTELEVLQEIKALLESK